LFGRSDSRIPLKASKVSRSACPRPVLGSGSAVAPSRRTTNRFFRISSDAALIVRTPSCLSLAWEAKLTVGTDRRQRLRRASDSRSSRRPRAPRAHAFAETAVFSLLPALRGKTAHTCRAAGRRTPGRRFRMISRVPWRGQPACKPAR
jgi:hypothetical protein